MKQASKRQAHQEQETLFHSPTFGALTLDEVLSRMRTFQQQAPECQYRILIGTDSLAGSNHSAALVSAIVFVREGRGGIYFWRRKKCNNLYTLRDRMYQEALASIDTAKLLMSSSTSKTLMEGDIEIHVDVGHVGPTRDMIREIVGMVKANGFPVKTKPFAVAASTIADRHTISI